MIATALLAVASNGGGAFAYDDRFPHLWKPPPAQLEQSETASESVPFPRRAPHRAKPKGDVAPVAASPPTDTTPPTLSAGADRAAASPLAPMQPAGGIAVAQDQPTPLFPTLSSRASVAPGTLPQAAAALSVPSPLDVAALSSPSAAVARTSTAASFDERFTFVVSLEPAQTSHTQKKVSAAALNEVPLPRPAPKRIRTQSISGAALPFAPISGDLASMIEEKAKSHGVPLALAHAVVHVESRYNPKVTGRGGTHGLMQIKYATAKSMGYDGTVRELYDPETNLEWGMRYLGGAHRLARGDVCGTVMRYQGGLRTVRMSDIATKYCGKVRALLARRNDPAAPVVARASRPSPPTVEQASVALPAPPTARAAALSFQ